MAESSAVPSDSTEEKVKLESSDEKQFEVEKKIVEQSVTIKHMLEGFFFFFFFFFFSSSSLSPPPPNHFLPFV